MLVVLIDNSFAVAFGIMPEQIAHFYLLGHIAWWMLPKITTGSPLTFRTSAVTKLNLGNSNRAFKNLECQRRETCAATCFGSSHCCTGCAW